MAASLLMYPSGFKATKLYSQIPTDGTGDFTVSRNSVKTRVNSSLVIEEIAAHVPSLDYTDGVCPVLLAEPQSTNLYLNMEVLVTQDVTVAASEYTVSFYGTGTITFTGTHTGSLVGTGLNDLVSITFTPSAGTLTSTISGTVTEGQIELGAYASSRIITAGTTVTRLADVISGAGDVNTFNSEEGVFYVEMAALADDGTNRIISISDGTNNHRVIIAYTPTTNQIQAFHNNGINQANLTYTVAEITDFHKIAFKYKINDFALWIDGIEVATDLSGGVNTSNTFNEFKLENASGTGKFYGKIKSLKVFNRALSDDELLTLTTQ